MSTDELPPIGDASALGDGAASPRDGRAVEAPGTSAADPEATQALDVAALIEREKAAAGADGQGDATQAFDVAALIALEKSTTRRAVSAAELEDEPEPAPAPLRSSRRALREAATGATRVGAAAPASAPVFAGATLAPPTPIAPATAPSPAGPDAAFSLFAGDPDPAPVAVAAQAPVQTSTAALAWVTPETLGTPILPTPGAPVVTELLPPVRKPRRAAAIAAPLITAAALGLGYIGGCALWPLGAVSPTVSEATIQPAPGKPLGVTWPQDGTAAVGAEGLGTIASSNAETASMASITKVITVLMILEKAPLAAGEDGPSYGFTYEDRNLYWQYLYQNESALDVPVDGTMTERQMLEGILIGSANNYIDRLTTELWGSKDAFVAEVPAWLQAHGLGGITVVDASGIDPDNTATAADLVKLASLAMADPTVAQIVQMPSFTVPGAEGDDAVHENTNPLLGEPGVVGVKTGTLLDGWREQWNLLTAKDITIGQTTVRVYSAVLGQPDEDDRETVSRQLLEQVEASLQLQPSVPADTVVATVSTEWGASAEVVTTADAQVVLWDSGTAAVASDYDIELGAADGATVGELTATGPFDSAVVPLELDGAVPGPSLGWRLTHPLDLLGLQ